MKKLGKGRAAKADLMGTGKSSCFGAVCRLANFSIFGDWGGFISGLRRLSIGLVTASSRFCRWEENVARLFFQAPPFMGMQANPRQKNAAELKQNRFRSSLSLVADGQRAKESARRQGEGEKGRRMVFCCFDLELKVKFRRWNCAVPKPAPNGRRGNKADSGASSSGR